MRFVVFDDETVEPITVVNLPGMAERDIVEHLGMRLLVPIPSRDPAAVEWWSGAQLEPSVIELRFERFVRRGIMTLMCFAREAELAMLLEPAFLPGQRRHVAELQDRGRRLADLIVAAIGARL